ncbi:AAA family ATPase [Candidatus Gracilibacteria bacterium]|nr:AAA family ATPase [Candidatus Gracilibacteria bacterium]
MKLVFTGIQGCGKGTQARLLVEKHGFRLLEMGGEFRRVIASGSELGKKIQKLYDAGDQITAELGVAVMEDAVQNIIDNHNDENVIFDAFVRNDWNLEIFNRLLPDYQVVLFRLSEEKSKQRLLGRMFNPKTGETFMTGMTIDPKTGDDLIQRADDNEDGILKRIDLYNDVTLPIVRIQRQEGRVLEVNADQAVEEVFAELESILELN